MSSFQPANVDTGTEPASPGCARQNQLGLDVVGGISRSRQRCRTNLRAADTGPPRSVLKRIAKQSANLPQFFMRKVHSCIQQNGVPG